MKSRSREGAWIEITYGYHRACYEIVAPVRERGLKFRNLSAARLSLVVAPVRERGLKYPTRHE